MKTLKSFYVQIFFWLLAYPIAGYSQKAFETIHYKGMVKEISITCNLANGYIGATEIKMQPPHRKPLTFIAASESPDERGKIKFLHYINPQKVDESYFILYYMKEAYEENPRKLFGVYHQNGKKYKFELHLVKASQ